MNIILYLYIYNRAFDKNRLEQNLLDKNRPFAKLIVKVKRNLKQIIIYHYFIQLYKYSDQENTIRSNTILIILIRETGRGPGCGS